MSRNAIQFETDPEGAVDILKENKTVVADGRIRSVVFKPEYDSISWMPKAKWWVRILPRIKGSNQGWMFRATIHEHQTESGLKFPSFVSPKTFDKYAKSAFAEAYTWFKSNHPELLMDRKTNPNGFKFRSTDKGLAWFIKVSPEPQEGEDRIGIFSHSLYDGQWGGSPGLAYKLWVEANAVDTEPGADTEGQPLYGDITHPTTGRQVYLEKSKQEGAQFATYGIKIGSSEFPLSKAMDTLSDEEFNKIVPLEEVLNKISYEEEKSILKSYIGSELFDQMYEKR